MEQPSTQLVVVPGGLVGLNQIKIDTSSPTEVKNSDVTKSVNFTQAAQTVLKKEEDEET